MNNLVDEILISENEIMARCVELGKKITKDYEGKDLVLIGLLKGCIPFLPDLAKRIDLPLEIYYMIVSSYHGATSSGEINIKYDLEVPISGRDVLVVEDIIDTGLTIKVVIDMLKSRGAKSISVVTLLDKEKEGAFKAEYVGFTIPEKFVIGYGLDFDQKYRNLPYIGVLKKEFYE